MSLSAAVIRELIAAGLSGDALADACERIEAASPVASGVDAQAERRRAKDRERKRLRNSAESAESAEFQNGAPPTKETSPRPPKENYPLSSEPTVLRCESARRHDWPEDFADQLWSIYPRKTEKKAGMEALARLHRSDRVAWLDLIEGVETLLGCDPQFVPALARWLKGERWKDERPIAKPPPTTRNNRSLIDGLDEIERRFSDAPPSYPRLAI